MSDMRINMYSVKLVKESGVNYSLEERIITSVITRDVIEKVLDLSGSSVEKKFYRTHRLIFVYLKNF